VTSQPASTDDLTDVLTQLDQRASAHREALESLVAIPGISAEGFEPGELRRSAEAVRQVALAHGCDRADLLEVEGAPPAVLAERDAAPDGHDAPTVLLYAHHDVQPPGDTEAWTSPPFEPTEADGRLYGRGTADDKAGLMAHLAAVDAWARARGGPPCHVKLLVEGEEEVGSTHLSAFLAAHGDRLRADAVVVADTVNWKVGVPTLTTSLRGLVDATVEVRALDHTVHSGMYGGPVPDPVTALTKLLAGAVDDHGVVAIPGFADDARPLSDAERHTLRQLDFDVETFRAEAGLLDGVPLAGDPDAHPLERLWRRPHLTVVGFDAPEVAGAANALQPAARAKVSVRLAPGQDPHRARRRLVEWLQGHTPFGLQVEATPGTAAAPFEADTAHPAVRAAADALALAYGRETVLAGLGGSIPLIEPLTQRLGDVPVLMVGIEDPDTRAHGIDESLHLADFARACSGQARLLEALARSARPAEAWRNPAGEVP
jgi:acetylornithine deacetylase/succinyl-diaminopimelate desuccinylase-like protein